MLRVRLPPTPLMEDKNPELVRCPFCGRIKAVEKQDDGVYYCTHCDKLFDPREDDD